jgi:large subunit ribosomal protein L15
LPKRGFGNGVFSRRFVGINLSILEALGADCDEINRDVLVENGVIKPRETLIKILGDGKLTRALKVIADKFSRSAKQRIEAAGGSAVEVASRG